jgi:phosphoribosylanthranilate isomerase
MNPNKSPRIKICCISSTDEAKLAVHYGADALGLVSAMPSGPGVISNDEIARISRTVPPATATFLLTSSTEATEIVDQVRASHVSTVQLVDHVEQHVYASIRSVLPNVKIVQVIHVVDELSITAASVAADHADSILLDSGNPTAAVKELGGTGRIHDWEISRRIRQRLHVPVFLAGGLNASNVREAIDTVEPYAIDLCSGVRTNGKLDADKLVEFIGVVRSR